MSRGEALSALYSGLLGREPDESGFNGYMLAMRNGESLASIARGMASSPEFLGRHGLVRVGAVELPDLTELCPRKYVRSDGARSIFNASQDEDFAWMLRMIDENRYYDHLGVWSPVIDRDKRVTAAIVLGLGAKSCVELGCFSGPVLSVLADRGVDVCGVELSHIAFILAFPNVLRKLKYGDLLDVEFDRTFDVFVGMDILEHLNPIELPKYVRRIHEIVAPTGFALINSPMIGNDDVFGLAFDPYLPEWRQAGEGLFWRHMDCDAKGWPMHGHLVWASPRWWEQLFSKEGLVRDRRLERHIQLLLKNFFGEAPGRRSLFLLRHADHEPDIAEIEKNLTIRIDEALASP
ncbi:methyltransferase domain-containing protein [Methylosinus sp. Ce-a6]|uniref:methyltransferase domain-containing protein n=1 Tax=Methylosinus sp. Ce-a6 TaxID=2172005 RepID=UPI0013570008|nr:methyltransferase domain-containing protein [Methylosinus sp. Ce-a6]